MRCFAVAVPKKKLFQINALPVTGGPQLRAKSAATRQNLPASGAREMIC